jgi:hypothetical protein
MISIPRSPLHLIREIRTALFCLAGFLLLPVSAVVAQTTGDTPTGVTAPVSGTPQTVYQWSLPIDSMVSKENNDHPRAFLWIPPDCRQVRAIVIAEQNMEEEQIFQDSAFRKAMGELGFAEIWITPPMESIHFRFDKGEGDLLDKLLKDFAALSGYQEIAFAPLVPMGHSATSNWPHDIAAWNPQRVLACLSISGQWPYLKEGTPDKIDASPDWGDRTVDGVPCLTTKGEYEIEGSLLKGWYAGLKGDSLKTHPKTAFCQVVDPGGGHFGTSDEKNALIILFLRKAAQYRLPASQPLDAPAQLTPIDPANGWLYDTWRLDQAPTAEAAPAASYTGNRDEAYWAFDQEMAQAIEAFQGRERNKPPVLLGYKQSQGLTPPVDDHIQCHLKFEPTGDGMTFDLSGAFWDHVPTSKDGHSGWLNWLNENERSLKEGDPLDYPKDEEDKITIAPICGPVRQIGPHTFAIRFNRGVVNNWKRSGIILNLRYPGDDKFKRMVQQGEVAFPRTNMEGQAQTITFPDIPDQRASASMPPVKLQATSSAGLPVYYYVREGPAEVDDSGTLTFTGIPPRSAYPIKVTVVAWQWGRSIDPKAQTATPVEKSFSIQAPGH